jgi:serine phosphatase RsbU (regulator of sigma subunit)
MSAPQRAQRFFAREKRPGVLDLTGVMGTTHATLGFEVRASAANRSFAVYAENPLPTDRRSRIESNSAFSDLHYALYIGRSQRSADLLVTNVSKLPIEGTHAAEVVPFGTAKFTLVVAPKGSLGGVFFRSLPWIIAVAGVLMTLAGALLTDRLVRRRERAERLATVLDRVAAENREMYREQRSISQTLQHALLPEKMPELRGAQVSARYVPAGAGVDVGGDWYDVVPLDDGRVFMIIGDVSGHGLRAATTMALLRHAALAYAAENPAPDGVLGKLSQFVGADHDYFATVLCTLLDIDGHGLTVASAGHMAPLVIDEAGAEYVAMTPGPALGVMRASQSRYRGATVSVRPSATVLAFTDGLVERRGEVLDVGLARLRNLALQQRLSLDDLLATLARKLTSEEHTDDTAILGIQWQS